MGYQTLFPGPDKQLPSKPSQGRDRRVRRTTWGNPLLIGGRGKHVRPALLVA